MKPVRSSLVLVGALSFALAGCYNWRNGLTETASVQHSCPPEQIRILSDNGDGYARVVQLDVCGQRRVYQDQGGRDGFVWVDQTPITVGGESVVPSRPEPQVLGSAPQASSTPVPTISSDSFAASVRAHITERTSVILACSGIPVAIEAMWDPSRSTTVALSVRGVSDPAIAECIGAAIGSIAVPPDASPGRVVHAVSN